MKTPIEVKDIRKGDLIRCEKSGHDYPTAVEYVAAGDRQTYWATGYVCDFFLLNRPAQVAPEYAIVLRRDLHRLRDGLMSVASASRRRDFDSHKGLTRVFEDVQKMFNAVEDTPAVAVPASALDELRAAMASSYSTTGACHKFLAAVDAANGDAS